MDQLQLQPSSSVQNWNAQSVTLPDPSPKKDSSILRNAVFLNLKKKSRLSILVYFHKNIFPQLLPSLSCGRNKKF